MRLIALSEIFSALNLCLRPSRQPVEKVTPVLGNHSSEIALLPLPSWTGGVDSPPAGPLKLGTVAVCAIMGDQHHRCLVCLNFPKDL